MKEFYEANQAVKSISTASEKVPCHACGIENAKLACASCKMFSYCSKVGIVHHIHSESVLTW